MQELLTLKEIAQQLDVPASNLRYYKNKIGGFLPSVGKGRRRRYLPESVEVLKRTRDLIQEGMTLDRVYTYLAQEKPLEVESPEAASAREAFADRVAEKLRSRLVDESAAGAPAPEGQGDALRAMTEGLREELSRVTGRIETLAAERERLRLEAEESSRKLADAVSQLAEKEKIIEFQRSQLLDARDKRLNIQEELRQIRNLVEEHVGKHNNAVG